MYVLLFFMKFASFSLFNISYGKYNESYYEPQIFRQLKKDRFSSLFYMIHEARWSRTIDIIDAWLIDIAYARPSTNWGIASHPERNLMNAERGI